MTRFRFDFAVLVLCLGLLMGASAHAKTNILFIVDASGSMKKLVEGSQRMDVAKKVLRETLTGMPADAQLGLLVYGHRKAKDCSDIELLAPIGGEDAKSISKMVQGLTPKGETPIAESLRKAAKSFKAFKGQKNSIILVTDGVEECEGDPCAAAKELKDAGLDVAVNIVGFTLGEKEGNALKCVTETTGGQFYAASNTAKLTEALKQVQKQVQDTVVVQTAQTPKDDGDILAAKNGGTLVYAPNDKWAAMNTGKLQTATYGGEGVWSFKDGRPATFARIELLIPDASGYNLKNFEVLAADSAAGPFRSLGEFTTLNSKVMPEGWQAFTFPEATAKFVKVVFKTDHGGGYIRGQLMRLIGKIDENATIVGKKAQIGDDILSSRNGGTLVYAPNDKWAAMNTGKLQSVTYGGEGVWSFKDGRPATFSRIELLIPDASGYNLKNFEVFAGDDANGHFKSLGAFTIQNAKVMPEGWQTFTFAPVTAKFVKVSFLTDQGGGYIRGHELRLFGKVNESAPAAKKPVELKGENILAQSKGGMLLLSPNREWSKLNDGDSARATTYHGEGIWSFANEKPAIIEAVDVLVPGKSGYNLKDFEVLVGNDGPTGSFKSLGSFTTQNIKVMPDGYQRFTFPKALVKYVKINLKTDHGGGYIALYEIRVIGTLKP